MKTWQSILLAFIVGLVIGFFVGRKTIQTKEVVKYVKGETITDTLTIHMPVKEVRTTDTLYLVERDTVKTIIDYNLYRTYQETISGAYGSKIDFTAGIQYNKLQNFSYVETPVYKEVTIYKVPVWQPYAGASYNTFNEASLSIGTFYHDLGIEASYLYNFDQKSKGVGVGVKYKF